MKSKEDFYPFFQKKMIRLKRGLLRWLASTNHKDIEAIIFFLGFVIWIQDISFTTILIAVSTGIKIFRWVRTLQGSKKIIDLIEEDPLWDIEDLESLFEEMLRELLLKDA